MDEIASVQVRLYLKPNKVFPTLHQMLKSVQSKGDEGVPLFNNQNEKYLDLQYGAKWTSSTYRIWEKFQARFSAMWCRWYLAANEHDVIKWSIASEFPNHQRCRYGFDTLRITWYAELAPKQMDTSGWKIENWTWIKAFAGSYYARNHRVVMEDQSAALTSSTTPVYPLKRSTLEWQHDDITTPSLGKVIEHCENHASKIEFFWKGRLVRAKLRDQTVYLAHDSWYDYCLDDWDNCVDPYWLAYQSMLTAQESQN